MSSRLARGFASLAAVVIVAACGGTSNPTTAQSLGLPASAIPTSTHPDLHGMSVSIADQGAPTPDRIMLFHVTSLLNSWGANAKVDWAASQQIAASAILRGSDQVYTSTLANTLPSLASGFNVVVFGINQPRLDYVLLVKSSITSLSQLKGQNVGVLTGGPDDITYVLVKQSLLSVKLDIPDVHLVTIGGQTARVAALVSGRISATVVGHQYLQKLASSGFHSLDDYAVRDPNIYNDLFWAPPSWLQANPELAIAFNMAALDTYRALDDPNTRQALEAEGAADSPGATTDQAKALYDIYVQYNMFPPNAVITTDALTSQEELLFNYHNIDTKPPVANWAVTKYDQAALAVVGTAK
jgi:ABC-type nitrate/sulfonate/bicarbonate transport system substrate-binding protein